MTHAKRKKTKQLSKTEADKIGNNKKTVIQSTTGIFNYTNLHRTK